MKVKHLIKKLQSLNPESNVYFGSVETKPVSYLHLGTRLKSNFIFKSDANSTDPNQQKMVEVSLLRDKVDKKDLHNEDVLITNWNGIWD